MREFLDAILAFIESESLTDEEFETITLTEQIYTKETYEALRAILEGRENVSGQVLRLKQYFEAKGVDFTTSTIPIANSNILIGSAL
jgi:hypothetical protein